MYAGDEGGCLQLFFLLESIWGKNKSIKVEWRRGRFFDGGGGTEWTNITVGGLKGKTRSGKCKKIGGGRSRNIKKGLEFATHVSRGGLVLGHRRSNRKALALCMRSWEKSKSVC